MRKTRLHGSQEILNRDAIINKIKNSAPDGKVRSRSLMGTPMASEFPTPNIMSRDFLEEIK